MAAGGPERLDRPRAADPAQEVDGQAGDLLLALGQGADQDPAGAIRGGVAGVEVTPMYGKFAFYEGTLGHFTFVINAGAGLGNTRIQLRPQQQTNCDGDTGVECREASFGDTGLKFVGSVGAGFRVFLGERAAIRLEVRDLIYTARVDKINGCSYEDLYNIGSHSSPVNGSCTGDGGFASADDRQLAMSLLKETSSDVINNVSFFAGFSFLF